MKIYDCKLATHMLAIKRKEREFTLTGLKNFGEEGLLYKLACSASEAEEAEIPILIRRGCESCRGVVNR